LSYTCDLCITKGDSTYLYVVTPKNEDCKSYVRRPKILAVTQRTHGKSHIWPLLSDLITMLSNFTTYVSRDDAGYNKDISYADIVRIFYVHSISLITPFRYLVAVPLMRIEEHASPWVIKSVHARLTSPINLVKDLECIKCINIVDYDDLSSKLKDKAKDCEKLNNLPRLIDLLIASYIASLLTAPTRLGMSLRQVYTQAFAITLYLISKLELIPYAVLNTLERMFAHMIYDTYTWYAQYVSELEEPRIAEYHYMVASPVRKDLRFKDVLDKVERLVKVANIANFIGGIYRFLKFMGPTNREVVLGRLVKLHDEIRSRLEKLRGIISNVVTIATEQWGPGQLIIINDALNSVRDVENHVNKFIVLYTQSVMHQRFYEEMFRSRISNVDKLSKYVPQNVEYRVISSTDVVYNEVVINNLLSILRNNTFVISQGPLIPALKLYVESVRKFGQDRAILI